MKKICDVIIVGGGPAGYTAAIYTARAGLSTLVIEKFYAGGQMTQTTQIDNYPGFPDGIDGFTLGIRMQEGAHRFGVETVYAQVLSVQLEGRDKLIRTTQGDYTAKAVILATGADHKHLGLDGEAQLIGKGISYCAVCDGMFFRDKTVGVVGGGNSAAEDALTLSKTAKKVYLIHRRDALRASKVYHDKLEKAENVELVWNSTVRELLHGERLTGVRLENVLTGQTNTLGLDGLFVSIGREPVTQFLDGQLQVDEGGYIVSDESTQTSMAGVFAAGDVRSKVVRQIITAAADGAIAAHHAQVYLREE